MLNLNHHRHYNEEARNVSLPPHYSPSFASCNKKATPRRTKRNSFLNIMRSITLALKWKCSICTESPSTASQCRDSTTSWTIKILTRLCYSFIISCTRTYWHIFMYPRSACEDYCSGGYFFGPARDHEMVLLIDKDNRHVLEDRSPPLFHPFTLNFFILCFWKLIWRAPEESISISSCDHDKCSMY